MAIVAQFLPSFLLIFCRITAFFAVTPIFSSRNIPNTFKVGIAFFVSLLVFVSVGNDSALILNGSYLFFIVKEILIGLLLGFVAYLFFTVVQVAGSFIDLQMGFGIVNVMDPLTGAQSPVMGNFKFFIAMLFFLGINGHHYLLLGLMNSYEWVPFDNAFFSRVADGQIFDFLLDSLVRVFYLAFQMAAPIIVTIFLAEVALGMLARTVPTFNVFVLGMPIKILVGFLVLLLIIVSFAPLFRDLFTILFKAMEQLIGIISTR